MTHYISESEMILMKIIWKNGGAALYSLIMDELEKDKNEWKNNTVLTLLSRLIDKKFLKVKKIGRQNEYVATVTEQEYQAMQTTLISFLKLNNLCRSYLASITLTEGVEELKERLGAIINFKKKTKLTTIISLLAAILLSALGFAIGAYEVLSTPHEYRTDLTRHIMVQENINGIKEPMIIIHESADILHYQDGSPYIHDILTNNTDKRIIETEYCMLAFNEKGSPLKLRWNFLDSSAESSYENLIQTKTSILPNQTENYHGGWSLYDGEITENMPKAENGKTDQVAYSLFCLKQVVFDDGTVWNNQNYENWYNSYVGKEIDVVELQNYYPYKYELELD